MFSRRMCTMSRNVPVVIESLEVRRLLASAAAAVAPAFDVYTPASDRRFAAVGDTARAYTQYQVLAAKKPGSAAPLAGSGSPQGTSPSQIRKAYGVDNIFFGAITGDGTGQTIAIVDAYDDPSFVSS